MIMKYFKFVLLICMIAQCLSSCSTINQSIIRNHKKTDKVFDDMFNSYGNAFTAGSSYINFSYVWSYSNGKVFLAKLSDGRITENIEYLGDLDVGEIPKQDRAFKSCREMDGDYIVYRVNSSSGLKEEELIDNIQCFMNAKKEGFYQKLSNDIESFGITW